MPPERQTTQKRRQLPFKPPRPASANAGPSTSAAPKANSKTKKTPTTTASSSKPKPKAAAAAARKSKQPPRAESPASEASGTQSGSESGSGSGSPNRARSPSEEPDYILAEITHPNRTEDVRSSEPAIPPKLLTKLLHHNFQNEKTKLAKEANGVVAKYIDVFVREALARAAYEKAEGGDAGSIGDGFLEVEDLEKLAPQLVLDF